MKLKIHQNWIAKGLELLQLLIFTFPLLCFKEVKNFFLLRYVPVSLGSGSYCRDSHLSELLPSLPGASQALYDVGKSRTIKNTKLHVQLLHSDYSTNASNHLT